MNRSRSRIEAPDVRAWLAQLEAVLAETPPGVCLHGMDDELLVVDVGMPGYEGDLTETPAETRGEFMTAVADRGVYRDSGGW